MLKHWNFSKQQLKQLVSQHHSWKLRSFVTIYAHMRWAAIYAFDMIVTDWINFEVPWARYQLWSQFQGQRSQDQNIHVTLNELYNACDSVENVTKEGSAFHSITWGHDVQLQLRHTDDYHIMRNNIANNSWSTAQWSENDQWSENKGREAAEQYVSKKYLTLSGM